jgi:hypothetical protein
MTGAMGEIYKGVRISEETRQTPWAAFESRKKQQLVELQHTLQRDYVGKGLRAVIFGVHDGPQVVKYAIFAPEIFLGRE